MTRLQKLEHDALLLPDADKKHLAMCLLDALSESEKFSEDYDDPEGLAEAIRRNREMDEDPTQILTRAEFEREINRFRKNAASV